MIVVDAMVLVYQLLPYPQFAAEVDRVQACDAEWIAPPLWRSELRNTLLKYVRATHPDIPRSDLDLDEAVALARDAEALLANKTLDVDSETVIHLAAESGCSAYDCEYVILAREHSTKLVTYDRGVLEAFPETAVHPQDFA